MKHTLKLYLTLLILVFAHGIWADYYANVDHLSGDQLYNALHTLISTNSYSNYTGAKTFLFQELDNDDGTVTCIYTGLTWEISSSYNGSTDPNTEHTFCQSWFSSPESSTKKADTHHLFISSMPVNSSRGNLPYGNVSSIAASDVYYSYSPLQSYRGLNNWRRRVWQVNEEYRGDIARAILYFNTRYGDSLVQAGEDMLQTLIAWHYEDPPTPQEVIRNNKVQAFQSNRNPFVDHPEYVNRIWDPSSNADENDGQSPVLRIDNIYPNPFRDEVKIAFDARTGDELSASIFNLRGQKVYQTTLSGNIRNFTWNARSENMESLPSGVYLLRVQAGNQSAVARLLMLK